MWLTLAVISAVVGFDIPNQAEFYEMCYDALNPPMNPSDGLFRRTAASWHGNYSVGPSVILIVGDRYAQEMERGYEIGTVEVQGKSLHFTPEKELSLVSVKPIYDYVLIRWGKCQYLVDAKAVVEFCNDVNAGNYPRGSDLRPMFQHTGAWGVDPSGKPDVPAEFRRFLLDSPINCSLTSIGDWEPEVYVEGAAYGFRSGFRCRIDSGSRRGVFNGMILFNIPPLEPPILQTIVVAVREHDSDVIVTPFSRENHQLTTGIRLSTREPPNAGTIKSLIPAPNSVELQAGPRASHCVRAPRYMPNIFRGRGRRLSLEVSTTLSR